MEFLYLLEKIRLPGLNEFMLAITTLGEETAFLVVGLLVFWCFHKKWGYYVMSVGFCGNIISQFMKILCRIPRPWVLDENFTILEQAREAATGYSFPSGHTQMAVGTFGSIAVSHEKRWVKVLCITLAVLVGFSRMYIGVHTPQDVLVSAMIAVVLIFLLRPTVLNGSGRSVKLVLCGLILMALGLFAYVEWFPFPADIDAHNLESGVKNAYTMLGSLAAVAIVYVADEKWLHFEVKASLIGQILKVVLGLLAVLLVKEGLRAPLNALFGGHMAARAVRYFLIVIAAGIVWPLTFRFFEKLGKKEK